jgi:hypothetical protein
MPETTSLQPEDLKVDTYQDALRQFHHVDQDPADPASGRWDVRVIGRLASGTIVAIAT